MPEPLELTSNEAVEEMLKQSWERPVLLYKHSVSCPISGHAWYEVQDCLAPGGDAPSCYRVTVQFHAEISRSVAALLDVIHHTPQVIIVRDGKARYVASHWQIKKQLLQRALMDNSPSVPE